MQSFRKLYDSPKMRRLRGAVDKVSVVTTAVLVFLGFSLFNDNFLTAQNINNILGAAAPLFFMTLGLTFVILTGSIDLSTGAVCSFACVVTGLYVSEAGNSIYLVVLLVGVLAGLMNGLLVAYLKMPSFIVTLCSTSIWKCAALVLSAGASKSIPLAKWDMIAWSKTNFLVIPTLYILAFLLFLVFWFIQNRTTLGKSIYAVGANVDAARLAGVKINRARIAAFLLSGVGSALAGACYALRLNSSSPTVGDSLNLVAVASVVLGGTWLSGGRGSVFGTMFSVLTVTMLQSALKVVGLDAYWQDIIFGAILVLAIYLNSDRSGSKDVVVK